MAASSHQPIAVFHEHPHWFAPLFAELDRRGLAYLRLDAASHSFDPAERSVPYSVVFNRASPSAYLRGHAQSLFYTLHWLRHLDLLGVPVINGADVYGLELSKALQLDLLDDLRRRRDAFHAKPALHCVHRARRADQLHAGRGLAGVGRAEVERAGGRMDVDRVEILAA